MAKCPACGFTNKEGMKFCNECGGKMEQTSTYKCHACGHTNNASMAFCGECGAKRGQPSVAPGDDPLSGLTPEQLAMIPPEQREMIKNMSKGQQPASQTQPAKQETYKCAACGHTNNASMAFCVECGAKKGQPADPVIDPLSMLTPEQRAMIPPEQLAELQNMDKGSSDLTCPSCGHANKKQTKFCMECGAKMSSETPAPKAAKPKRTQEEEMQEMLALQESMKSGVMLTIDGKKFKGGSAVSATIIGLTDQMKADGATAILVPAGAPHEKFIDKQVPFDQMQQYAHMMPAGVGAPSGMMMNVKFVPPYEGGDFEIRLFKSSKIDKSTFLTSAPFTATAEKEAAVTIALDKETCDPKGSVMVTVNNVSESMVRNEAFVGLYKEGAGRSDPIVRKKLTKGEFYVQLQLPDDIGGFEVRVFKDGTKPDGQTAAAVAKLRIKGLTCPSCGTDNPTALKECAKCGATLQPGKCNECGYTDNPPGAEYCEICGAKRSA